MKSDLLKVGLVVLVLESDPHPVPVTVLEFIADLKLNRACVNSDIFEAIPRINTQIIGVLR